MYENDITQPSLQTRRPLVGRLALEFVSKNVQEDADRT